jgi:hypothetical protein
MILFVSLIFRSVPLSSVAFAGAANRAAAIIAADRRIAFSP